MSFHIDDTVFAGEKSTVMVVPDDKQSESFLQCSQAAMLPGPESRTFLRWGHRLDDIFNLKWYLSEKIRMRIRSNPLPPAKKSNGVREPNWALSYAEK